MKNEIRILGIIALAALIGLSMAACFNLTSPGGGDSGGDSSGDSSRITYPITYDADGNSYELTISKSSSSRAAAYTPTIGDTFVLIIKNMLKQLIGQSTGTVKSIGEQLQLTPDTDLNNPFEIKISGGKLESISGDIPLDNGALFPAPAVELITAGTVPVLTDFITLPYTCGGPDGGFWNPKTIWKTGGKGETELEKLCIGIRGTDADNDLAGYVLTLRGFYEPITRYLPPSSTSFTWYSGHFDLSGLTAGDYTAEIYVFDSAGNKSNTLTTEFTIRDDVNAGSAPFLTDFITLTRPDSINGIWNPKTVWKEGGQGDTGIQRLNVAVQGTDSDNDLFGAVITLPGISPIRRELAPNQGNFRWGIGTFDLSNLSAGTYTASIYVVDKYGNKSNTMSTTFTVTSQQGKEDKSVTITGLNSTLTANGVQTDQVGVWLFKTLPVNGVVPVNTAIQSLRYTPGTPPEFRLVVPRDNTWNGTNGISQPRWDGDGSYYVAIVPIVNSSYRFDDCWIYTEGTNLPVTVEFNTAMVTLDFSKFVYVKNTTVYTTVPVLTDFITLPYACYSLWNPKTIWKTGGKGDAELERLCVAIKGTDADNDLAGFVLTLPGISEPITRNLTTSSTSFTSTSFTWYLSQWNLSGLTAGVYTAEIYAFDRAGNNSNTLQTTITVQDDYSGTAPVLTEFITLTRTDAINNTWAPKTEWIEGGQGDTGIQRLNVAIKGTDSDKDLSGYVLTVGNSSFRRELTANTNTDFAWYIGNFDLSDLTVGNHTASIYVVDKYGNKSNEMTAPFTVVAPPPGEENKSVTIMGLNSTLTVNDVQTDQVGVWIFETLPDTGRSPVNTAIQSLRYTPGTPPVFKLVVPYNNTWNGDPSGLSQPRWNGNGSYYVAIVPIVNNSYRFDARWIYTNGTSSPVMVEFNTPNVTLDFSNFSQ